MPCLMSNLNDLNYAKGTHAHKRSLFRISHRRRFTYAIKLLDCLPDSRVLDFGSGDGYLLELLSHQLPFDKLTALEPLEYLQKEIKTRFEANPIRIITSTTNLADHSFDRIACLEVLEHLQPVAIEKILGELKRLVASDGTVIISVPIEVGPSALLKYLAARLLTGSNRWYTISDILRATVGLPVARDGDSIFIPHKGFDFRLLKKTIKKNFAIEREVFSPFPILRSSLNSQVIWKLTTGIKNR
jgi:2-polyprenyl-3-methyl-5-hydroxy-6-metoxy-1,4-benzoquinol methylase